MLRMLHHVSEAKSSCISLLMGRCIVAVVSVVVHILVEFPVCVQWSPVQNAFDQSFCQE